jgi:hypothetical protein
MTSTLINPSPDVSIEKVHLFNKCFDHVEKLSNHRQWHFGTFMTIHLVLLPTQAALVSKEIPIVGLLYSIMVGALGVFICVIYFFHIRKLFTRINVGYELLREMEVGLPYRFVTELGKRVRFVEEAGSQRRSWIKAELAVPCVFACIYASLPFIHHYVPSFVQLFGAK